MASKITKGPPKSAEPPVSTAADDRIPSRKKGKKELPPPAAPTASPFETIGTSIKTSLIQVGDTAQRLARSARVFSHTVRTASARPEKNIVQAIEDGFADAAKAFAPKPDFAGLADEAEDYLDAIRHAAKSNPKLTPVVREMEAHYQGLLAAGVASAVWDYHHDPDSRPVAQRQAMDFADSFYRAVPTEDSLEGVFTTYAAVDLDVAKLRRAVTRNAETIRGHVSKKAYDASQPLIDAANRGLPMGDVPLSHPSPSAQGPAAVFLQSAVEDQSHIFAKANNAILEPQLLATEARIAALIQSTHADAPFRREAHLGLAHVRMGSPAVGVRHLEAARQIFRDKGEVRPAAEDLATQIGVLHRIAEHSSEDVPRARDRLSEAGDAISLLAKRKGMRNPAILLHVDNLLLQLPHRLQDQEDFLKSHPDEVERYHRAVAMEHERIVSYCTRVESDDKTVMGIVRGQGMMQAASQFEKRLDGAMSLRLTGATEEARQAHIAAGNAFTKHTRAFEHTANPALMHEAMGRMHWSNATYTFKVGDVEQSVRDLRTLTVTYGASSAAQILRDGADDTWVRKYGVVDATGNLSPDVGRPSEIARWKKIADAALSDKASAMKAMMAGAGVAVVGAAAADAAFGTHIIGGKVLGGLTLGKLGMIGAGAGLITERGVQVLAAQHDISAAYRTGIANVTTDELADRGKALAGEVAVCFIAGGAARYVRMGVMGLGARLRAPLLKGILSEASIAAEGVAFHEYSGMIHGAADHSAMGYFRSILTLRMLGAGGELNLGALVFPGEKWADAVMRHGFNTAVANIPLQAFESAIARDLSGFGHGYFDSLFGLYAITVGGKVPEAVMRAPQLLARAKAAHQERRVETLARQFAQVAKKDPSKAKVIARTIAEIIKTAVKAPALAAVGIVGPVGVTAFTGPHRGRDIPKIRLSPQSGAAQVDAPIHKQVPYSTRTFIMDDVLKKPAHVTVRTIVGELKSLVHEFSDLDEFATGKIPRKEMDALETNGERMLALLQDIERHSQLPPAVTGEPVASVLEGYLRVTYDTVRNKPLFEKTLQFIDDHSEAWLGKKTAYADTIRAFITADARRAESRNDAFDNALILNCVRLRHKRGFGNHDNAAVRLELQKNPEMAIHVLQADVNNNLLNMHRPPIIITPKDTAKTLLAMLRAIAQYPDMPRPDGGPPGESAVAAYIRKAYQDHPQDHAEINRALKDVDDLAQTSMAVTTHFFEMGAPYRQTQSIGSSQPKPAWQEPPEAGLIPEGATRVIRKPPSPTFVATPEPPPPATQYPEPPPIVAAPVTQVRTAMARNKEILSGNHGLPSTHYGIRNFQSASSTLGSLSTPNAAFGELPGFVNAGDGTIVALTRSLPRALEPSAHLLLGVTIRTFDPSLHPDLIDVHTQMIRDGQDVRSPLPNPVQQILQREPAGSPLHQAYRSAMQDAGGNTPTIEQFFKRRVSAVDVAGAPAEVSEALTTLIGTPVMASKPKPGPTTVELPGLPPPLAAPPPAPAQFVAYSGAPFIGDMARRALKGLQNLVGGPPPGQATPVAPADVPARPAVMGGKDVLVIPPRQGDSASLSVEGFPGVEYRWHRGHIEIRDTRELEPETPIDPETAMHVRSWNLMEMPIFIDGRALKPNTWHQLDYGDVFMLGPRSHTLVKSGLAPRHLGGTPPPRPPVRDTPPPLPPRPGDAARQVLRPRTPSQPRQAAPPDIPPAQKEAQAMAEASQSLHLTFQEGEVALDFSTTPEKAIGHGRYGITDPSLAAHHATLMYRDGFLFIRDCGSPAGTFVNNERVSSGGMVRLYEGDRVRMGETTFAIHHPQGALDVRQVAPTPASGALAGSQFRLVSQLAGAKSMTIASQRSGEAVPFPGMPGIYLMIDTGGRLLISDTRDPRKTEGYRQAVAMQHAIIMGFGNAPISRNGKDIPTDRQWHPLEDGDVLFGHIMACTVSITPQNPIDVMLAQDPALRKDVTSRLHDATSVAHLEQLLPATLLPSNLSRAALQTVNAVMSGRQTLLDLPEVLQPVVEGIMNRQVAELLGLGYDSQGVVLDPKHTNPKWSATEKAYHRGMAARNLARQIAETGSLADLTRILETSRVSSIRYQQLDTLVRQLRDDVKAGAMALQHLPYDLGLRQKLRDILEEHRLRDTESAARLLPEDARQHTAYRELDHAEDALYLRFKPQREALYQVLERGKPLSLITRDQQMRKSVVAHMEATIAIAGKLFPMEMAARENIYTGETVTKEHIETGYRLARMLLNAHANRPVWGTPSRAEQSELISLVQRTFGSQAAPNYLQAQRVLRYRLEEMGPGATRMLQIATPGERALILESYFGAYSHRVIPDPAAAFRLAAWLGKSGIYREVAMSLVAVNGHYYGKVSMGHTGSVHRESSGDILVMHTHPEEYTTSSGTIMGYDYDQEPATMAIGLGIKSRDSRTIVFSRGDIHHFLSEAKRLQGNAAIPKSVVYDPESRSYRNWVLHPFGGSDVTIRLAPNGKPEHITVRYAKMPGGFFNENYRHGIRRLKIFCETELDIPMTATEVSFDELMASVAYPLNE